MTATLQNTSPPPTPALLAALKAAGAAPRCGAKTRAGTPCQGPAVRNRKRCRMHGCAPGSGAPRGSANALKHGLYTRASLTERELLVKLMRNALATLAGM